MASVLMIFFAYCICQRVLKVETYFSAWERRNNCRIISKEPSLFYRKGWYRVVVEDNAGKRQNAWVKFGLFTGKDTTVWD